MENWEFLLQKEGDRTWLPLESPDVEILEGRYRVVARSNCPNTDLEVRIAYQAAGEQPPQRRVQKRSTRTNPEGLMVVIPYTRLKPGIWELCCLTGPDSGKPQEHNVQLQVLPAELELGEVLSAGGDTGGEESEALTNSETQALDRAAEAGSAAEFRPEAPQNPRPKVVEISRASSRLSTPPSQFALKLTLERDNFVAQLGEPLTITGEIGVLEISQISTTGPVSQAVEAEHFRSLIATAQLHLSLRDPQTSQVLAEVRQPLPSDLHPPCAFACTLYVPATCRTRLILGEAVLWVGTAVFASQPFAITARVEHLLAVVQENFSPQDHRVPSPEEIAQQQEAVLNESFLNLSQTLKESSLANFSETTLPPAMQQPLPPQIAARSDNTTPVHGPELPTFVQKSPEIREDTPAPSVAEPAPVSVPQPLPTNFSDLFANLAKKGEGSPGPTPEIVAPTPVEPTPVVEEIPPPPEESVSRKPTVVDQAFQAINCEDRFWVRLNSLANDAELSEWLKSDLAPEEPPETTEVPEAVAEEPKLETEVQPSGPVNWETQEVVIFDEPPPLRPQKKVVVEEITEEVESFRTPYILPEEEPVPMPVLEILDREVVAGRVVKVRVQLPELLPRIYVKIWVYDRQSYVIVDGPRWLTEFTPNGLGTVETIAELEVTYGCLEIEFEAIAVEMQTQRESHKVSIPRQVVPPAAPSLPLEGS